MYIFEFPRFLLDCSFNIFGPPYTPTNSIHHFATSYTFKRGLNGLLRSFLGLRICLFPSHGIISHCDTPILTSWNCCFIKDWHIVAQYDAQLSPVLSVGGFEIPGVAIIRQIFNVGHMWGICVGMCVPCHRDQECHLICARQSICFVGTLGSCQGTSGKLRSQPHSVLLSGNIMGSGSLLSQSWF